MLRQKWPNLTQSSCYVYTPSIFSQLKHIGIPKIMKSVLALALLVGASAFAPAPVARSAVKTNAVFDDYGEWSTDRKGRGVRAN